MAAVRTMATLLGAAALCGGCALPAPESPAPPSGAIAASLPTVEPDAPRDPEPAPVTGGQAFDCEDRSSFVARFEGDAARIERDSRPPEQLLRDAGGTAPQQSVWSNDRLRAEFGLGGRADEALLHPLSPPQPALRCRRR